MLSLKRFEGYLLTDHSQGPGLNQRYPNEKLVEEATIGCVHCGVVFVKNPDRERPREFCRTCDRYMCDPCARASKQPDYVHRSFVDIANLIMSGNYRLEGSLSCPILIPILKEV